MATAESWKIKVAVGDRLADVQMYTVDVETPDKRTTTVKRFSNFVDFRDELYHTYRSLHPHLTSNIPELPPRELKFRVDHTDRMFLETRRKGLEQFCQRLTLLPYIVECEPFHLFFTGADSKGELMYSPASTPRASLADEV
eukprot:Opistho-1_new@107584